MQEFSTEGLLWIQDLTMADPYYILPVVLVVTNLLNIEVVLVMSVCVCVCV